MLTFWLHLGTVLHGCGYVFSHMVLLQIMQFYLNPPEGFMGGGILCTILMLAWITGVKRGDKKKNADNALFNVY